MYFEIALDLEKDLELYLIMELVLDLESNLEVD